MVASLFAFFTPVKPRDARYYLKISQLKATKMAQLLFKAELLIVILQ